MLLASGVDVEQYTIQDSVFYLSDILLEVKKKNTIVRERERERMGNLCSPSVQETDVRARYDIAYCFVNAKSGGGVGKKLLSLELRRLRWTEHYGSVVIVDLLSKEERERSVKELAKLTSQNQHVCAICAGGDGTVKWILQVFAKAKIKNVRSSFFFDPFRDTYM